MKRLLPDAGPNVRRGVAGVGYLALALAVVTAVVPGVGGAVASVLGGVFGGPLVVFVGGLLAGGYGLLNLYRTGQAEPDPAPLSGLSPERAHYSAAAVSGEEVDESVDAVGGELPESAARDWWTYRERNDVQTTLRELAVDVLASEHDVSRAGAADMIAVGSWTDDDRAAAFLGGDAAATLPLRVQFLDWLSGRAYQRRVEATVDAIARHAGLPAGDAGADDERPRTATASALPVNDPQADDAAVEWDESTAESPVERPAGASEPDDGDGQPTVAEVEGPYPVNDGGGHEAWSRGGNR